jgi:hypothetical protein
MEEMTINLPDFSFTKKESGWIYKAIPKKRTHVELPEYNAIDQIDSEYQRAFDRMLGDMTRDISKYLNRE